MGHPSKIVMSHLFRFLDCKSSYELNKDVCEICFLAKQTRNQFSFSESKIDNLFEIIHYDIWGSYGVSFSCGARYFLTVVDCVWIYLMGEKEETERLL